MPSERRTGTSYMPYGVVACLKRRHTSPGCGPLTDGAAAGRHLEGGNSRHLDVAPKCLYGMTYHNRVVWWHI